MNPTRWLADKIHRWTELHRSRRSQPAPQAESKQEKLQRLASAVANPDGPVEDYVSKFKELIEEWLAFKKPVTFFTPGMMTESGEPVFDDPRLGKVRNARVKSASWLVSDGKGRWKRKDLGYDGECRSNYQREVVRRFDKANEDLQRESQRRQAQAAREGRQAESDWWGTAPDSANWDWNTLERSSTVLEKNLPYPPGPFTKQMYLQDMWKLDSLIFQFVNYSGLAKRALAIKTAYILGAGVKIKFRDADETIQDDWDEIADEIGFYEIMYRWVFQWLKYGELNINPWVTVDGKLRVRSIDRSTIWDIVTNPEDIYDIHGYWVQFTTQYQLYTQGTDGQKMPFTEYVMRMMPPDSIIQSKRNVDENEKRGRSDLIASLAVMAYYDDTIRAVVMEQILRASWVWDVEVLFGEPSDIDAEAAKITNSPKPGSTWFHTSSMKRTLTNPTGLVSSGKSNATQEVISAFAVACGVPEEFFGMASMSNRAAALTGTAPFVKQTQVDQNLCKSWIRRLINFWLEATGKKGAKFEVIFPEIAPADMYTKIQAIVLAQTSGYYSQESAGFMVATELNDTTYDYDDEQALIRKEKAVDSVDPATEQNLYPGGHPAPLPGTEKIPQIPKIPTPGAGLPKLKPPTSGEKTTGPAGSGDQLGGSGIGM